MRMPLSCATSSKLTALDSWPCHRPATIALAQLGALPRLPILVDPLASSDCRGGKLVFCSPLSPASDPSSHSRHPPSRAASFVKPSRSTCVRRVERLVLALRRPRELGTSAARPQGLCRGNPLYGVSDVAWIEATGLCAAFLRSVRYSSLSDPNDCELLAFFPALLATSVR
jgi:hypothetical protein